MRSRLVHAARCVGLFAAFVGIPLLLPAAAARADVLARVTYPFTVFDVGSAQSPVVGPLEFTWTATDVPFNPPEGLPTHTQAPFVFEGFTFSPGTVGQTVTITPETDPHFAAFAQALTDGTEQWILHDTTIRDTGRAGNPAIVNGAGGGSREPLYLFSQFQGPPYDLAGYRIEALSETHDSFSMVRNTDGTTNIAYNMTLTIEGTPVPEPAALGMMASAGALLLRRRIR